MHIYKKVYPLLVVLGIILFSFNCMLLLFHLKIEIRLLIILVSVVFYVFVVAFFRVPERKLDPKNHFLYSPADGKVVAIEEVFEDEFLKMSCKKVSIFMSVFNVHQNRIPTSGRVVYYKHHPGKYMVAWHPKSSLENEHTSVVIEKSPEFKLLVRQIAGIVARRIICNVKEGCEVKQGDELGFILFGSRVDVFVPIHTKIIVELHQKVKANRDIIAYIR